MLRFENKTAVVTGGNSGIGLATAKRLKAEGARVIITGRDARTLESAASEFGFIAVRADVAQLAEIDRMYQKIANEVGTFDVLFANAGIFKGAPVSETSEALFDEIADVNFKGLFFTVQRALPILNDGGAIVINSSTLNTKGLPGAAVYSATKAAVRSLTRTFAAELLPRRIRVNAISPGATATPIFGRSGLKPEEVEAAAAALAKRIPSGRFATPEDIAAGVAYLASADANSVIGAELTIDGGTAQI